MLPGEKGLAAEFFKNRSCTTYLNWRHRMHASAVTHQIFYLYFLLALLRPDLVSEALSSLLICMQCNLTYCIRVASFARLECYFVSHSLPRHLAVVHVYHPLGAPDFKQRSETRVHSKYWNLLTPPPPYKKDKEKKDLRVDRAEPAHLLPYT